MGAQKPNLRPSSTPRASKAGGERGKGRTSRACDRCRLKKAKCDGLKNCQTCQASDSVCMYTARRLRESGNYYCQMQELTAEAIQRLYWACRTRQGFPGDPPDESTGEVTTTAILKGLGLMEPEMGESASRNDLQQNAQASKNIQQRSESEPEVRTVKEKTVVKSSLPLSVPKLDTARMGDSHNSPTWASLVESQTPSDNNSGMTSQSTFSEQLSEQPTPSQLAMQEQFMSACALSLPPGARAEQFESTNQDGHFETYLDSDNILDKSSCTETIEFHSLLSLCQPSDPRDMLAMLPLGPTPHTQPHGSLGGILSDGFLSPWPGTLAAAYYPVTTG